MLSQLAIETLKKSRVKSPLKTLNRSVVDKLRREGFITITVNRGPIPERFFKITPEGERFLEEIEQ